MENLLQIRETLVNIYKNSEAVILFAVKVVLGILVFSLINGLDFTSPQLFVVTKAPLAVPIIIILSFLFAALPITMGYMLLIMYISVHFSASIEIAATIFLFLLLVVIFYARLAVKESLFILLTVLGFYFNLEYVVVLIAGMYFSFTVIIPIVIGTFIWEFTPSILSIVSSVVTTSGAKGAALDFMDIPQNFSVFFASFMNNFSADQRWIYYSFVFAMVIIVVNIVSRLSIDYAKDIALLLGSVLNIISFIIVDIIASVRSNIFLIIFFSILSLFIAEAIKFFDIALDYQRSERVQFEDEENYYFIKVVPKAIIGKPSKRTVKRIISEDKVDE